MTGAPAQRNVGLRRIAELAALSLALCMPFASGPARADATALAAAQPDADALSLALRAGHPPVRLQPLATVTGCGPQGCGVLLGRLFVDADTARLHRGGGPPLAWVVDGPIPAADLPDLSPTLLRGFRVLQGRQVWGDCLEFAHAGLGSSGHAQRWRSVVLVAAGSRSAQRVVGYQAACAALAGGPAPGQVLLPTVQGVAAGQPGLQIVWHRCSRRGCQRSIDQRRVEGHADSESGQIRFTHPSPVAPPACGAGHCATR